MPDSTMPSKVPAPPILTANFACFDVLEMHEIGADERADDADDADRKGDWCGLCVPKTSSGVDFCFGR